MWTLVWLVSVVLNGHDGLEATDRLTPPGWKGNPWGPQAYQARREGTIPPLPMTPLMKQWERWGNRVLRDGDILFRRGDAKLLRGYFPFSRFIANVSGSPFSHTGIAAIEDGEVVVYDTTKAGVRRQPFRVWVLDNVGPFGVKRVKPEYQAYTAKAVSYCRDLFQKQAPFDYDLNIDDKAFYCVEMSEKAYRSNGLPLADPVRLGDMENITQFPICVMVFLKVSNLNLEQPVFFPGNERHGIWSSSYLMTVYAPPKPSTTSPSRSTATTTVSAHQGASRRNR
ncbi:MAG: hypothetical protein NVSMB9_11180 [Isosphaeraceae bacterium]